MAEANFSASLAIWKEINLSELQKTLDTTALELVEGQKEGLVGRKRLAEQTREFRKLPDDSPSKLPTLKPLLKAYQTEIDLLTRRSRTSETAFLSLYKLLAEAPDPYPLLDAAVEMTVKVAQAEVWESELGRLREERREGRERERGLEGEREGRRRAEARVAALEEKMEDLTAQKVTQKENELNAEYDERMRNYAEREKDLQKQVATLRDQLKDLHTSNESTQARLANASSKQDQDVTSRLAELDLVVADLERANERVATVERRNEALRKEIESVRSGSDQVEKVKQLESQISELEAEAARLLRHLEDTKSARTEAERKEKLRAEDAAKQLASQAAELDSYKSRVKQYGDYDEIKRELEIMKYVEFSSGDLDDGDLRLPDPNADKANQQHGRTLESLLSNKNKRLQEDLTRLRVANEELETALETTQSDHTRLQFESSRLRTLNEKLENDLLQLDQKTGGTVIGGGGTVIGGGGTVNGWGTIAGSEKGDASRDGGVEGTMAGGSTFGGSRAGGLAGLDLGRKAVESGRNTPQSTSTTTNPTSADTSILPIITSQRDRFRQRNAELEEELRKQHESIGDLRAEVKTLQGDNLKLYEKVRYMGSYKEGSGTSGGATGYNLNSTGGNAIAGPSGTSTTERLNTGLSGAFSRPSNTTTSPYPTRPDDSIGKYKDRYEESMNPFEAFKGREAQRAIQALNPAERAVFALTRAVVGNKRARGLFILYSASLHILVVWVLYECMGVSESRGAAPIGMAPITPG